MSFVAVTAATGQSITGVPPPGRNRKLSPDGPDASYRLLLIGSSVSMLGTRMSTIAYPMLVLYLTRSPVVAGWAAFAATAPSVLAYIPAGALVDRWNARKAMLVSECGRGLAVTAVVIALVLDRTGAWLVCLLMGMAVVEETLEVFSALSERRLVTGLLGRDEASLVLGRSEARTHVVILAGRPMGGLLFGFQHIFPFLSDAVSFVFSIVSLLSIKGGKKIDPAKKAGQRSEYTAKDILMGLQWVRRDSFARAACSLNAGATLVAQALIMIFLAEADQRKLSYFTVGLVLASTGAGGALGSIGASRLRRLHRGQWLKLQMWLWLAAFAGIVLTISYSLLYLFAEMFALGLSGAIGNIEIDKYLIEKSPEEMFARVASVNSLMDFLAFAIGPVLGGVLVQVVRPHKAILGLLILVLVLAVWSVWMPSRQGTGDGAADCARRFADARS